LIILETERLMMRHFETGDLEALAALYRDPELRKYYPEGTLTLEETRTELEWHRHGHPQHPELGLWATLEKETGQFIGRCGLLPWLLDGQEQVEIAYLIARPYWRQGLGTEAASGIRDYAFEQLGLMRLICLIDKHNQASIRVAEKIGMAFEKEGRDELGPFHLYALQRRITA
jgi:RimJ/RimL family protein N-acetyltransferase